jgi:RNA polymerase sigma-70 factor (ECF subfamily)
MPPQRPIRLGAWLAKITRNLSLNRIAARNTDKRGSGEVPLALDELEDCIPAAGGREVESESDEAEVIKMMHDFLRNCRKREREIFLRRYWYLDSIAQIAKQYGLKETNVTTLLYRMRLKLKDRFDRKGIVL